MPTQAEKDNLWKALARIGQQDGLRLEFLELCRKVESVLAEENVSIRDEVTAPIIDALHEDVGVLHCNLDSGIDFAFLYRSKIAREIVMAPDAKPDHLWEPQTTKLLLHLCQNHRDVLVGGAYSGDQAILMADRLGVCGGRLHAFEPNSDQLEMLKHNAERNALDNIVFNRLGLWNESDDNLRLVGDDSFAHAEACGPDAEDGFSTITIDDYGQRQGISTLGLIMLDIEGAELAALQGAQSYLSAPKQEAPSVVFEVHRSFVDWSQGLRNTPIVSLLLDQGYSVYAVRDFNANIPMRGQPVELVTLDSVYLEGPPHGFNMLAVKDEAILEADVFRICEGVSPKLLLHKDPALHHPMGLARRAA